MSKWFLLLFVLASLGKAKAADPKYSVASIPEDLKTGMYAVVREHDVKFYIDSKNHSTYYVRKVVTILNAKAKRLAVLAVGYDKLIKIESMKANVYDAEGNLIKKLKQNEISDQSSISGSSLFEDNRAKVADLSQAMYPYTVEFEYVMNFKYLYFIPDFYLYDDDEVSTEKMSYSIIYPKDIKPRYRLNKVAEPRKAIESDNRESLTWSFEKIKPSKFEQLSGASYNLIPNIHAAPAEFDFDGYLGDMSNWKTYGQWQASLNKGKDVLPDATKQKLKDLTKNLKTTEEKARVVYEYLQNKTRYVSIQLGIGGYQPFDATLVDQTGYGDCKALSNYTVTMLKEVGVKAYYTVIMGGEDAPDIIADFPSNQFNHIIVCVPNNMDTLWLECTSQTNPFGYLGTFTGDRKGLVVTEDGGKLVHTIRYTAEQNTQFRTADVTVLANGDASAKVKTTYKGTQYEKGDLNFYLESQYDDQKKWLQKNISIPSFDVGAFAIKSKKDRIPTAVVNVDLVLKRFASVSGKRIFLTPNLMNRPGYIPEKIESRKTNVVLKNPYTDIDTIRFHLPEGIYPEFLPQPVKLRSRFGEYDASFTLDQGELLYIRRIKMNKGEFPAESYTELIEFYKSQVKADNTKMVFLSKT